MAAALAVEPHYSVSTVAAKLECSTDYVYDRIKDGSLTKVVELGSGQAKQRIPASVLQAFIDARTFGDTQ